MTQRAQRDMLPLPSFPERMAVAPETHSTLRAGANPQVGTLAFRPFGITGIGRDEGRIEVREEVTAHQSFAQLRRFTRPGAAPIAGRILVVPPLAGAFPYLMRDLVVALLGHAADVAVVDWPDARHVPRTCGAFGFDDNVRETAGFMGATGGPLHVVGICQGVVPALAAAALLAEEEAAPLSLSLIGGPVDSACRPTRLDQMLAAREPAALEGLMEIVPPFLPGAGRRVFPRRRQMNAFGLYLWRQTLAGGDLPRRLLLDEGADPFTFPLARLCWDMMDIPAEFFLGNVEQVFRRRALACGTLEVAGRSVNPAALTRTALLTLEGEKDDISAPGQTVAAHGLCPAIPPPLRAHQVIAGADHFALFYGSLMRAQVVPALTALMRQAEEA